MNTEDLERIKDEGQEIIEYVMAQKDCSLPEAIEEVTAWLIGEILGLEIERVTLH
jgi:hypothetical protein